MGDAGGSQHEHASQQASLPSSHPTLSYWQTSHPNKLVNHRSTSDLPTSTDIVVVGSGITAAFIVHQLLHSSENLKILVMEARTTCSGATGRNGGHMQPMVHDVDPHVIDFELRNFKFMEDLISTHHIPCDFRRLPGCIGFWNEVYFEEAVEALERSRRSAPQYANLVQVVKGEKELTELRLRGGAVGAFVQSIAATLSPYKLIIWMWQSLLDTFPDRLNLQTTTPVTNLHMSRDGSGNHFVHTHRGSVSARHIILATNGYMSHLMPDFKSIIRPCQAQMSALCPPKSSTGQLLEKSYGFLGVGQQDRVMSDYLFQRPLESGGHFMFGGGRSEVPDHGEGVSDDDFVDPAAEAYLRSLPKRLNIDSEQSISNSDIDPAPFSRKLDVDASWTGIMGYSKDHFPWVGGVPDQEGLWVCAGYTGHGMTNASGCGQHVAKLVLAAIEGRDWRVVAEQRAVTDGDLPEEYVFSQKRWAKQLNSV